MESKLDKGFPLLTSVPKIQITSYLILKSSLILHLPQRLPCQRTWINDSSHLLIPALNSLFTRKGQNHNSPSERTITQEDLWLDSASPSPSASDLMLGGRPIGAGVRNNRSPRKEHFKKEGFGDVSSLKCSREVYKVRGWDTTLRFNGHKFKVRFKFHQWHFHVMMWVENLHIRSQQEVRNWQFYVKVSLTQEFSRLLNLP